MEYDPLQLSFKFKQSVCIEKDAQKLRLVKLTIWTIRTSRVLNLVNDLCQICLIYTLKFQAKYTKHRVKSNAIVYRTTETQ